MTPRKPTLTYHPFEDLGSLLRAKSFPLRPCPVSCGRVSCESISPELDEALFRQAMEGVKPVSKGNYVERVFRFELPESLGNSEDAEIVSRLRELIEHGKGFRVSDTPEYVEGAGYHVSPGITGRLHQGEFSIQAHVDLHGLTAEEAGVVFEQFMKWAVTVGKKGVLIIHGRGLSSRAEPVLKKKVVEWLTRSPWRKWVIAYCSARSCDGGAGATYVLLRQRPISKRMKRGPKARRI